MVNARHRADLQQGRKDGVEVLEELDLRIGIGSKVTVVCGDGRLTEILFDGMKCS